MPGFGFSFFFSFFSFLFPYTGARSIVGSVESVEVEEACHGLYKV
jgi:hypothetical protein